MIGRNPARLHKALLKAFKAHYEALSRDAREALMWDLDRLCDELDPNSEMPDVALIPKAAAELSRRLGSTHSLPSYAASITPFYIAQRDKAIAALRAALFSDPEGELSC